jgi:hypothetical protein
MLIALLLAGIQIVISDKMPSAPTKLAAHRFFFRFILIENAMQPTIGWLLLNSHRLCPGPTIFRTLMRHFIIAHALLSLPFGMLFRSAAAFLVAFG